MRRYGLVTAGFAIVEWMMLVASIKAKEFQANPTPKNLTSWCDVTERINP